MTDVSLANLIAIDPGRFLGWAHFNGGILSACGLVVDWEPFDDRPRPHPDPEHFRLTGTLVPPTPTRVDYLIWELPQIRIQGGGKGDPNQMVMLAARAGMWVKENFQCPAVEMVFPVTWKGDVPKHIHHPRILKTLLERHGEPDVLKNLKVPAAAKHNVIDAIGLGLYKLGRL